MARKNTELPYFGPRVKAARERLGLTQRELADKINRSADTIWLYEAGMMKPRLDDIPRLANVLDIPIGFLFEEGDPSKDDLSWQYDLRQLLRVVNTLNPVDRVQLTTTLRYLVDYIKKGRSNKRDIVASIHFLLYSLLRYRNRQEAMEVIPDIDFQEHPFMLPGYDDETSPTEVSSVKKPW